MSKIIQQFACPSRAARFVGRRRGSVLILCVVLIVVLALIGTAMLSGTRIDRFTAQQHSYNTQIDLLVEGAKQVAKSEIVADLYNTIRPTGAADPSPQYRQPRDQSTPLPPQPPPALPNTPWTTYDHTDGYHITDTSAPTTPIYEPYDDWIASLVPSRTGPGTAIYWPAITAPLAASGFEAPDRPLTAGSITIAGGTLSLRSYVVPDSKTIVYSDGTQQTFPAMRQLEVTSGVPLAGPANLHLAADADGDGIADSLLCRLLPGELNGVTWYVAMRIVDNAAKINVNTAMSKEFDFDGSLGTGSMLPAERFTRYYTTAVGLLEMLQTYPTAAVTDMNSMGSEMVELNNARTGKAGYPHGIVRLDPTGVPQPPPVGQEARDDGDMPRMDFGYPSFGAALDSGLSRRLPHADKPGNPGYAREGRKWSPLSIGDMTSLLAGFTLLKPGASSSTLEDALIQSLRDYAPNGALGARNGMTRYSANQTLNWFNDSFNDDSTIIPAPPETVGVGGTFRHLRHLLATHNPVSNLSPQHDMSMLTNPYGVPPGNKCDFNLQLQGNNVYLMPDYNPLGAGGATGTISVAKTNVNTARFGELWRAYWNVMVDQNPTVLSGSPAGTPFAATAEAPEVLLYKGNHFDAGRQPNYGPGEEHPQQMFRSSLRDPRGGGTGVVYFTPDQQLLLRAALAAVNTEDLRDADDIPTQRDIRLSVSNSGGDPVDAVVTVYGLERQPYITEIYANTETRPNLITGTPPNPKGYVAIELYNPYPVDIDISNWVLAVLDRRDPVEWPNYPNTYPNLTAAPGQRGFNYFYIHNGTPTPVGIALTPPTPIPAGTVVPANGYLVLDNYNNAPGPGEESAQSLPVAVAGNRVYVQNLHWVVHDEENGSLENGGFGARNHIERRGGELVLLRRAATSTSLLSTDTSLVPVDSFDFTGLLTPAKYSEGGGVRAYRAWHYVRSNDAGAGRPNWKFVYPGRYQGDSQINRSQGIVERIWDDTNVVGDPDPSAVNLGAGDAAASYVTTHTIQLNALGFPGPHALNPTGSPPNVHPFGAFARNGDILQVTYIGSYRVGWANEGPADPKSFLELNPVTMDSCFANDCDAGPTSNDEQLSDNGTQSREQVGRFAPIRDRRPANLYDDLNPVGDFNADSTSATNKWRYRWAIDLFDYLTVSSPGNDYLPDVPTKQGTDYMPPGAPTPARVPVDNDGDGKTGDVDSLMPDYTTVGPGVEDAVPVQGLININTAPWRVIGALPFMPVGDFWGFTPGTPPGTGVWAPGPDGEEDSITLAKQIVAWRDGRPGAGGAPANGPFLTAFDLYRVPALVDLQEKVVTATMAAGGPDDAEGDFTPYNAGSPSVDPVRYDFEEQFLLLNRVSNLVTTRSDSFTVYILVQGWRNVGTATPEVVAQRRVAFIQDRSTVRPESPALPPPVNVPND